jgi:hypothetical protein
VLFNDVNEPLMKDRSYWGAIEAGIITGPESKVNKIWRYNNDQVLPGQPLPPKILAWDRAIHLPFGKKLEETDWMIDPKGEDQPNGVLQTARLIEPGPQLSPIPAFDPIDMRR